MKTRQARVTLRKKTHIHTIYIFIDLHQQQSPLLVSATVVSNLHLLHMQVGCPAVRERKETVSKVSLLKNFCGNH